MEVFFKDQLYTGSKSTWYSEENNENLLSDFQKFLDANHGEHILCFFSYDLKNNIEKLKSSNLNDIQFPQLFCFIPKKIKKTRSIKSEITDSKAIDFKAEISKKN